MKELGSEWSLTMMKKVEKCLTVLQAFRIRQQDSSKICDRAFALIN